MENALNVGKNGKYLFFHICHCTAQEGCNSTQVSREADNKYHAYHDVYKYTGLKLNELTEKNGTYYTEDGQDILCLVNAGIGKLDDVPMEDKAAFKEFARMRISRLAKESYGETVRMMEAANNSVFRTKNC